jgi:thiamine pyrophosphate-dependent acetolactate synthase large subunit-like protein
MPRRPAERREPTRSAATCAAPARPDRLTVATLGDGGALLALPELETLGRLGLSILVVIYKDGAYGTEVHHLDEGERASGHRSSRPIPVTRVVKG